MPARFKVFAERMGRVGIAFAVLIIAYAVVRSMAPQSDWLLVIGIGLTVSGVWLTIRLLRRAALWRLRNRLLVTYLFIAVVPIVLLVVLAFKGTQYMAQQIAVYLVSSELDRRIDGLADAAQSVIRTRPVDRPAVIKAMIDLFYEDRYPGIQVLLRDNGRVVNYPALPALPALQEGWQTTRGTLMRDKKFYVWSYTKTETGDITVTAPLTSQFLEALAPGLGVIDFLESPSGAGFKMPAATGRLPPPVNRFDDEIFWFAPRATADWDHPGREDKGLLVVRSRLSAVLAAVFNRKADFVQDSVEVLLIGGLILFVIVEIISVIIGITLTRTITGAVHRLYQGTRKMIEGDFSHRIEVTGSDQLADLSRSFNSMTENLERLLIVAKEKERLQSEIEIAREVQSQLYPRTIPKTPNLRLAAICQPARMVSGDYYDYECIRDTQVALAIGDVAGKGISAALLMATLQSSLRTQLQSWLEVAAAAGKGSVPLPVSTSRLVSRLNNQLHAYTSPEKYATFLLGVYDEPTGVFSYTNAGHLPPILVRQGVGERLDVNGTVVGAFPFSSYGESRVDMKSGDLLVCFTDGITEPENEYGEMFGEDRLVDLVERNAHRTEDQIIEMVLESVQQWTASGEMQDDMTILMARRV